MGLLLVGVLLAANAAVVLGHQQVGQHGGSGNWIPQFKNLVTFGDSYTDETRLSYFQTHNGSAPPPGLLLPSSNNTSSGGLIWDRVVADSTGAMLYDYAVSGAVCDNKIIFRELSSINGPFPDVVYEISAFQADVAFINASTGTNTLYTDRQSDNTVYSMWIGTNDLGVNAFLTDSSLNNTVIPDYVDCIFNKFDAIYKEGGRFFVLMNTAPLQLTPLYAPAGVGGEAVSQYWDSLGMNITEISFKMKEYTELVNDVFSFRTPFELLVAKRYPGASFAIYDVHSLLTFIYNNPTQFFQSPANVTGAFHECDATGANCVDNPLGIGHFMWFDDLHPSVPTDVAIANEFVRVVQGKSEYASYWS